MELTTKTFEKATSKLSWQSALIGAASATAAAAIILAKPRDPIFHVISIGLTSLKLSLPVVDTEFILTVHVTNPNIVPINYTPSIMSIYYDGALLGTAEVQAGSQAAKSCEMIKLPGRLYGLELAHHGKKFLADVAKREMVLDASVDIQGTAKVMWWSHGFKIHVDSHIVVDPVFLEVIEQENKSQLDLFVAA
ncbi:hypothetical protein ACHQM5_013815 [Ranunculus cassubicifolius]